MLNKIGRTIRFTDVNSLYGHNVFGFFVSASPHLAKPALAYKLVDFVLVDDLPHVEWSGLGLYVDLVAVLDKSNIVLLKLQTHQVVKAAFL